MKFDLDTLTMRDLEIGNRRLGALVAYVAGLKLREQVYHGDDFTVFDMSYYGFKTECGTRACLAGYATQIPALRRAGLRTAGETRDSTFTSSLRPVLSDKHDEADEALSKVFRMTLKEAHHIFFDWEPGEANSRGKALREVRSLIAERKREIKRRKAKKVSK